MLKHLPFLLLPLVILSGIRDGIGQIPAIINYQGVLRDGAGNPVTGQKSIQFSIYSAALGGSALWTETQNIVVDDGYISVLLGSVTPMPLNLFGGSERYLSLKIGSDPEMTPRKRLAGVGYSFRAAEADHFAGKDTSEFVRIGQGASISSGMLENNAVTIGKILPDVVSSVDGVSNDGGNIDLMAGSNVTITPDDATNTILISAAGGAFSLPYSGSASSSTPAFSLINNGLGKAGHFEIDQSGSSNAALFVKSNGIGFGIDARHFGSGGAANFGIENLQNASSAFSSFTKGTGSAGTVVVYNTANTLPALEVLTHGSGPVVSAQNMGFGKAGEFGIQGGGNASPAMHAYTYGTGQAGRFSVSNAGNSSVAISATTNGTGGAGEFKILNANNPNIVLKTETSGSGSSLAAVTFGSDAAGRFNVDNPANTSEAVHVETNGSGGSAAVGAHHYGFGIAGSFKNYNSTNTYPALHAWTAGKGFTAMFQGSENSKGVYISSPSGQKSGKDLVCEGLLVVAGKFAVVGTTQGARGLQVEESTEAWFTDYGFGRLENGHALVPIDPLFAETVNLNEPYHVFVQSYGDAVLYVGSRTTAGFEVHAREDEADTEFSYRIVARRLGYEELRLPHIPEADDDPNLFPMP